MSTVTISAGVPTSRAVVRRRPAERAQRAAGRQAGTQLRLTRRGRLAATVLVLCGLLTGGVVLTGGLATAGTEPGAAATAERVTVRPGETLWSIALREAPGVDPRDTVEEILRLNHLESSAVEAGSVLLLP